MNISEFKSKAFFFPKGKILPNWVIKIVKGNKKGKHKIKSHGCYILVRNKTMYITPQKQGEYSIAIKDLKNVTITLNPYQKERIKNIFMDLNDGEFEKKIAFLE